MPLSHYYYTADLLIRDGVLLLDDVQLRSLQQPCDFLDTERERWRFAEQIDRTRSIGVEGRVIEGM